MKILATLMVILTFIGIGYLVHLAIQEDKQWQIYQVEHECVKIGEIKPSTGVGTGIASNGSLATTTVVISGKTGYRCNDGMEYWR